MERVFIDFMVTDVIVRYFTLRCDNISNHRFEAFKSNKGCYPGHDTVYWRCSMTNKWYHVHNNYHDGVSIINTNTTMELFEYQYQPLIIIGSIKLDRMYQELLIREKKIELEKQRLSYGIMCLKFNGALIDDISQLIAIIDY